MGIADRIRSFRGVDSGDSSIREPDGTRASDAPHRNASELGNPRLTIVGRLLFVAVLVSSALARESPDRALDQAIVWLPSGVGVAGLWILGWRAWWCVALGSALLRFWLGYTPSAIVPGALGSTAEALLGYGLLQRWSVSQSLARPRDVVALLAAAALAPFASLAFSWIARSLPHEFPDPFYSGWAGWWRMNALGVLIVVPVASSWFAARHRTWSRKTKLEAGATVAVLLAVLGIPLFAVEPESTAGAELYLVVAVGLFAAVRFGTLGAATTGAIAGVWIAVCTSYGIGSFVSVEPELRQVAAQMFDLSLVAVPLLFGALIAEREVALASRVSSEAARRAFQQFLPDTAYRLRGDGTIVDVYVPGRAASESDPEEFVGRSLDVLGSPELVAEIRRDIRATLEGAPSEPHDYRMIVEGRGRVREARYVRLGGDEVLCLLRDITRRKRTERMLGWGADVLELVATGRPSREVLQQLLVGITELTDDGVGSVLLLEGTRLYHAIPTSLPPSYTAAVEGVEIGPEVGSCGTAVYFGRTVVVGDIATDPLWKGFAPVAVSHGLRACWSVPIRAANGQVLGSFAIYYHEPREPVPDELAVVERAAALAGIALDRERREDLLASITRDVNEGIFRSTIGRGLVYANAAFARMFGYDSPEAVLSVDPRTLHANPALRDELYARIAERGSVFNEEVLLRRRDGSTFVGLVSGVVASSSFGGSLYFDGALSDITERKHLEEQLRQAQKMEAVGRLAGGVAHDFNNLLTAITGCAESLLDRVPADRSARLGAKEILRAAERGASLTRQLLAYSRQQVLEPQVHDMTQVVDELGEMLRRLIGEDIRLTIEHATPHAFVEVDRGQFEQVVLNLVLNARDAMTNGGTLRVATAPVELEIAFVEGHPEARVGRFVCLSVDDNGVGMDATTRARAFDPFFTTKALGKGTGLGLSTVYGIVSQSDGWVDLESAPGSGTLVRVYLPAVAEPAASLPKPVQASSSPDVPATGTILVVEDEELVRELVTWSLRQAGYTVLEAESGEHALEIARSAAGVIDVLVSDVVMPGIGGLRLAKQLREDRPGLRVLFMSGYTADTLPTQLEREADTDYLPKPFTRVELLGKLRALFAVAGR